MTNKQLAQAWAKQSKPSGKASNGTFHFTGTTLYSYRTPVAWIEGGKARITATRYSHTTSRHCTLARQAARAAGLIID